MSKINDAQYGKIIIVPKAKMHTRFDGQTVQKLLQKQGYIIATILENKFQYFHFLHLNLCNVKLILDNIAFCSEGNLT